MRRAFLIAAALLAACGKQPEPPKGGPGMAVYEDRGKRFSCEAPGDWKVIERDSGASFFGPPGGAKPFTASVSLSIKPKTDASSYHAAQAAAGGTVTPLVASSWGGRPCFTFEARRVESMPHSTQKQPVSVTALLVPLGSDLLVVSASANPGGEAAADEAFLKIKASLDVK